MCRITIKENTYSLQVDYSGTHQQAQHGELLAPPSYLSISIVSSSAQTSILCLLSYFSIVTDWCRFHMLNLDLSMLEFKSVLKSRRGFPIYKVQNVTIEQGFMYLVYTGFFLIMVFLLFSFSLSHFLLRVQILDHRERIITVLYR